MVDKLEDYITRKQHLLHPLSKSCYQWWKHLVLKLKAFHASCMLGNCMEAGVLVRSPRIAQQLTGKKKKRT